MSVFTVVTLPPIVIPDGRVTLQGTPGDDTLIGTAADEVLRGGAGADSMAGGAGHDIYEVDSLDDVVDETGPDAETDSVWLTAALAQRYVLPEGVEWLGMAEGLPGQDLLGNAAGNGILGGAGDDRIEGGDGADTLYGQAGGDTLLGGDGNDSLDGGSGSDVLDGGEGDDLLRGSGALTAHGGAGNDTLDSEGSAAAPRLLDGGAGDDSLRAAETDHSTLVGGDGNDSLFAIGDGVEFDGGNGDDDLLALGVGVLMRGGAGNDRLRMGLWSGPLSQPSTLAGGDGDDGYEFDPRERVTVIELPGAGNDTVTLGFAAGVRFSVLPEVEVYRAGRVGYEAPGEPMFIVGDDAAQHFVATGSGVVFDAGAGDDVLEAMQPGSTLRGGSGNDTLGGPFSSSSGTLFDGGDGDDVLWGGVEGSTLRGGPGIDHLYGSWRSDTYWIDDLDERIEDAGGMDTAIVSVNGWRAMPEAIEAVRWIDDALPLAPWVEANTRAAVPWLIGQGATLRFAFAAAEPNAPTFGQTDRDAAQAALTLWLADTRSTASEVTDVNDADVVFAFGELDAHPYATQWQEPLAGVRYGLLLVDPAGIGGVLANDARWNAALLREVGHALGLSAAAPWASPTTAGDFVTALSPQQQAAMHHLHGQSPETNSGDTAWLLTAPGGAGSLSAGAQSLIADGAGHDRLDASALARNGDSATLTLDLRPGGLSAWGETTGSSAGPGQLSIDYGSLIEDAIGSAGPDWLHGNAANNRLQGGAGDDTLLGSTGADTLEGGAGDDRFVFVLGERRSAASATIDGGAGLDTLELRITPGLIGYDLAAALLTLRSGIVAGGPIAGSPLMPLDIAGIEQLVFRDEGGAPLPNQPPLIGGQALRTNEDTLLEGRIPGVLDLDGDRLTYALEGGNASGGDLQLNEDGSFSFRPWANFHGTFRAGYTVSDGNASAHGTLRIDVLPVDDPTVVWFAPSDLSATAGQPFAALLSGQLITDLDATALSYRLQRAGGGGLPGWLGFDPLTLGLSGTPGAGDLGVLTLELVVLDGAAAALVPVLLGVSETPNQPPQAGPPVAVAEDGIYEGPLQAIDPEGRSLRYELLELGSAATLSDDGVMRFVPGAEYSGVQEFSVRVSDGVGGSTVYRQQLVVTPVDDPLASTLAFDTTPFAETPPIGRTLSVLGGVADLDGLRGVGTVQWLRDGSVIREEPMSFLPTYTVRPDDADAILGFRLTVTDLLGNVESAQITLAQPVGAMPLVVGTPGNDELFNRLDRAASVVGGAGDDTLHGGAPFDILLGGDGNDVLALIAGGSHIDGGAGYDALLLALEGLDWSTVDLTRGSVGSRNGAGGDLPVEATLADIEAVIGTNRNERFVGRAGAPERIGEYFSPVGGLDSIDGLSGIDLVEIRASRAACELVRSGNSLQVRAPSSGGTAIAELTSIERLRFDDVYLAFGPRAEEVAKVAFALWSPAIASSRYLFARGISYYDVGYAYETMIDVALGFFIADNEQQFADRLAGNVASGRSAADILALMREHGGAGAGQAGRAWATQLVADDPANMHSIELAGFISNGIACDLVVDGNLLFAPVGG